MTPTTVCQCLGGSTHATPEGRLCDLCGGIVQDQPAPPTTDPGAFLLEVWAEEPDTRVRIEPWGDGVIITVLTPWLLNPVVTSIAGYRWKRILTALKEVPGHD